jgi:tetratricopeptide (TPR) repeat protein/transglutaminase-like putative cysteine protease
MRHLFAVTVLFCSLAGAQDYSPSQPPFSASPDALQKAFSKLEAGSNPATVLLEEARYEFDAQGRRTSRERMIFKVWTKAGAENWAMIERSWAPWLEERPTVRARVITPDGAVHELDPKTIADTGAKDSDQDVLSDRHMLKAPLPAMEAGSVVEQEIVFHETKVSPVPGAVGYFHFGSSVPTEHTLVRIRAPEPVPLRFQVKLAPQAVVSDTKENGVRVVNVELGPIKPLQKTERLLPSDEPRQPHIVYSTGSDWATVARTYAGIVDEQLKGYNASRHLPKFAPGATREAKILAIIDKLNREIRYTGIEFSEASVIPRRPEEVLQRKYGDCKDKSTLAVAWLRAAGIEAHVALLDASLGSDIEPDLPGGSAFNHAIVYVPGSPDLWLDPTDTDLRLGVLGPEDQGRYALVARPTTTALIRTAELSADQSRVVETREFQLSELGRAQVTEITEAYGMADREYRSIFGEKDEKELREALKGYVEWTYGEAKMASATRDDPADLGKPYRLKIELNEAQRGTTARTEAVVGIFLSQIATTRLPNYFTEDEPKKDKKDEKDAEPAKPRERDFVISEPFTDEWHYVVHIPPGFRVRQIPDATEERLGPASLSTKFLRESDTTLVGDLKFTMPKRRFTAAEGAALRDAITELRKRKPMVIYCDQIGETALASGQVKEALAQFNALRKLHPNEALHAMQTARALLEAGAGATARAEAQRAVALEPASAQAYLELADVLKHDLIGRPMAKGSDIEGAVAAYRKALELNPDDPAARANLAILLEHNRNAERYGLGAKMEEALAEYKKVQDKLAGLGVGQNYGVALFRAGKAKELREYLVKQPDNSHTHALRICASALIDGSEAAIRDAGQVSGVQARQQTLASAAQTLLVVRQYALAADLFEAANKTANAAALTNLIQMLRKTKRVEDQDITIRRPEDAVRAFYIGILTMDRDTKAWLHPLSDRLLEGEEIGLSDLAEIKNGLGSSMSSVKNSGMPLQVGIDIAMSVLQFTAEGSDETGFVVRANMVGGGDTGSEQVWFVIREKGSYRLIAPPNTFQPTAAMILALLDEGKTELARAWLDRIRQELPAGNGDDPLSGQMFSRFWQQGQTADADSMRIAAALLLSEHEKTLDRTLAILEKAARSADAANANHISAGLAEAYYTAKKYDQALAEGERLCGRLPRSGNAVLLGLRAAYALGGKKEADRFLSPRLDSFKSNVAAQRMFASAAMLHGDTERAIAIEKAIVDAGRANWNDFNQLAWADLMAGKVTTASLEIAKRGVLMGKDEPTPLIHTLATIQAELDQTAEARAALLQRMTTLAQDEPDDDEWYTFGRIAEKLGLNDEAVTMYKRLKKPRNERFVAASSWTLAQQRLKALGK